MSEPIVFFSAQKRIYPRDIWGRYRQLKWLAMAVLLGIYYFVPWLRWDRGPHLPDQAILIDMPSRRAYFFFIEIWPQEVFYITGILVLAAVGLFFVTSLFGRVWCGYACPQTVWTDLFIKTEHLFQGDRNARMKRDNGPISFDFLWRKAATHLTWLLISFATGGAWVLYFNDAYALADQAWHLDVPWTVMVWVLGLTGSTYLMAGYAREQVCTYMCPYARFQSAMFDRDTLIVGYDQTRGEPRGAHKKDETWDGRGHCIDCELCVAVCPMGIDIRNGLQMQCIACGLCVDACNGVMDKVGLPRGLIRYDTENNQIARDVAKRNKLPFLDSFRIIRPRTFYYSAIMLLVGALMVAGLISRKPFDLHVLHDRNPLYVHLSDGSIRNNYTVKVLNKAHEDHKFVLSLIDFPDAILKVEGAGMQDANNLTVLADSVGQFRVLVTLPKDKLGFQRKDITFRMTDKTTQGSENTKSIFVAGE